MTGPEVFVFVRLPARGMAAFGMPWLLMSVTGTDVLRIVRCLISLDLGTCWSRSWCPSLTVLDQIGWRVIDFVMAVLAFIQGAVRVLFHPRWFRFNTYEAV